MLAGAPAAAGPRGSCVTVATDGSANFTTIQAAVDAVPAGNATPFVIKIKPGVYRGQVIVPADRPHVALRGPGRDPSQVVIVDDRVSGTPKPDGGTWGMSGSATAVDGAGFSARNLTFANDFDESAHPEITARPLTPRPRRAPRAAPAPASADQETLALRATRRWVKLVVASL
ncbi:pectinesterase family protein, partial [Micromonospora sp. CPCC 206061]|uniref:pectinesterase family protein n=1 Tax=Micromonospora sp. CPCC 206061 TaxID=3122410 RepID=UPI002FF20B2E